jgi:tetratricopeptide (TPR) repeat protein
MLQRQGGSTSASAQTGYYLAKVHFALGDVDEAAVWLTASLRSADDIADQRLKAPIHLLLARCARALGHLHDTREHARQALTFFERVGDAAGREAAEELVLAS